MAVRLDGPASNPGTSAPSRERLPMSGGGGVGAGALGNALGSIGQGLGRIAQFQERELDEEKARLRGVAVVKYTSGFRERSTRTLLERAAAYDGESEFSQPFADDMAADMDAVLAGIDDKDIRAIVERQLLSTSSALRIDARGKEVLGRRARAYSELANTTDTVRNQIISDPAQLTPALEEIDVLLAAVPEALRDKYKTELQESYGQAYVDGLNQLDPDRLKKELKEGLLDELLSPQVKSAAMAANRRELKTRKIDNKRAKDEKERNEKIAADKIEKQLAAKNKIDRAIFGPKLESHLASLSRDGVGNPDVNYKTVRAIYGEVAAMKFLTQDKQAGKMFENFRGMEFAGPSEWAARRKTLIPVPGSDNYANQQAALQVFDRQIADVQKARAKDPSAFAAQEEGFADIFAAAFSPEAAEPQEGETEIDAQARVKTDRDAALALSQQAQADMGIADVDRRVMSKGQNEQWNTALTQGDDQSIRDAAASFQQTYGKYSPSALEELKLGGLPDGFEVVIDFTDRNYLASGSLARALVNQKEIKKIVDKDDYKTIVEKTADDISDLLDTMRFSPQSARDIGSYKKAHIALAMQYVSQGEDVPDARRLAAEAMGRGYVFNGSWRMNASEGLQKHRLELRTDTKNISGEKLVAAGMDALALQYDTGLSGNYGNPLGNADSQRAELAAKVRGSGKWINVISGDGTEKMRLVVMDNGQISPVPDMQERIIEYRPDELIEMGKWAVRRQDRMLAPGIGTPEDKLRGMARPPLSLAEASPLEIGP